jgi:hypothetical protein
MKVQASIVLSFQAKTLTEAGAVLDDVLARAREREDVDVGAVELTSPPRDRLVTLPPVPASGHAGPGVPVTGNVGTAPSPVMSVRRRPFARAHPRGRGYRKSRACPTQASRQLPLIAAVLACRARRQRRDGGVVACIRPRGSAARREAARALQAACDHRLMSDEGPDRHSFEDVARALAEEVSRAVERLSQIDVDEIARTASAEAERARRWIDELGRWLREQGDAVAGAPFEAAAPWDTAAGSPDRPTQSRPTGEDPLRNAGPHPLDLPTADQGLALAALDSGRWRLEPGTSALAAHGDGPGPSDALGLVRELRARDWISAHGEITLAGRHALRRWLDAADRA